MFKSCVRNEFSWQRNDEQIVDSEEVTANSIYIEDNSGSTQEFIGSVLKEIVSDHVVLPLSET